MRVFGKIVAFDQGTWWGTAVYDLTTVEFHGTSVSGMRSEALLVGKACELLLFNADGRLYDIRLAQS